MKPLFNKALFKEQLKRNWSLSAFLLLTYIIFIIIPELIHSRNSYVGIFSTQTQTIFATVLFFPLIIVPRIFSYLFNNKESVTVLSYPIKKDSLWFTNALAGFVTMIIPVFILYVFNIIIAVLTNTDETIFIKFMYIFYVMLTFLTVCLVIAYNYAVCLISAHISGNIILYGLLAFSLPLLPTFLIVIGGQLTEYCTFGVDFSSDFLSTIFNYTNPTFFILMDNDYYISSKFINKIIPMIIILFITLILFGISFYVSKKRKQEFTGNSIVFKSHKNIIIFFISLFGMSFGANFFIIIFRNTLWLYIGIVVGFIISYYSCIT